jgi:hypothetical protein
MVCFGPQVSYALVVQEGVAADEKYGFMDGAGAVPDSTDRVAIPDSTDCVAVPDSTDSVAIPDPFEDAEALEELEEEITTLAAHIHAATHRLLSLIAEFDRRRGWELGGHRSCAYGRERARRGHGLPRPEGPKVNEEMGRRRIWLLPSGRRTGAGEWSPTDGPPEPGGSRRTTSPTTSTSRLWKHSKIRGPDAKEQEDSGP